MYYDKKIRYLSYYESDIKLQNAGYVKFQVRDSLCQMVVYVKGPRLMGSGETSVYLLSQKKEQKDKDNFYAGSRESGLRKHLLGNLSIHNGQGHCAVRMNARNMADSGLRYDEICGIKIELHEYQYLESRWNVVNFMPEQKGMQREENAGYKLRQPQRNSRNTERESWKNDQSNTGEEQQNKVCEVPEDVPVEINLMVTPVSENLRVEKLVKEETVTEDVSENVQKEDHLQEIAENNKDRVSEVQASNDKEETSLRERLEREVQKNEERSEQIGQQEQTLEEEIIQGMEEAEMPIKEEETQPEEEELPPDKWEQLRKIYPIVHPIREEEEYLKIAPKDFVVFTEKYQDLVHNSFLLHGYHNYKHLILGKKEKEGRVIYYLGVPGTFHDREKTVAVMFGFEAFDGKREPAENGDFGYYLRRVEI